MFKLIISYSNTKHIIHIPIDFFKILQYNKSIYYFSKNYKVITGFS